MKKTNYYCENCGDDDLNNPIDDGTGSIFCSEYCIEKSLEWRGEDIKKYINPLTKKEIEELTMREKRRYEAKTMSAFISVIGLILCLIWIFLSKYFGY